MEVDEVEPNPMPDRRKSASGQGSKKAQPITPTSTGVRRSKRRQAEPEPHADSDEDLMNENEEDYEDEDDDEVSFSQQDKAKSTKAVEGESSSANAISSLFGSLPRAGEVSAAELERIQALMNTLAGASGGAGGFFGGGRLGGGRSEIWTSMLKDLKSPKPSSRYAALQEATTTIALAQEDQFHYFPWEDAVKVFLGLMSGKPITEGKVEETIKDESAEEEEAEDDFDSMTEEQQMMYAMALSSGGKPPSGDSELDPEQDQQAQLLACRCLQNLMMASEGHGLTAGIIVRNGGVKVLCDKLTSIENIELAEQVIVVSAILASGQNWLGKLMSKLRLDLGQVGRISVQRYRNHSRKRTQDHARHHRLFRHSRAKEYCHGRHLQLSSPHHSGLPKDQGDTAPCSRVVWAVRHCPCGGSRQHCIPSAEQLRVQGGYP
jgi:hypothetical protein